MGELTNEDFAQFVRETPLRVPFCENESHTNLGINSTAKQRNKEHYQRILKLQEKREQGKMQKFRDRAAERRLREQAGEVESAELKAAKKLTEEESKYLGGDIEHTHLVKGLDFILLEKIRSELENKKKQEELIEKSSKSTTNVLKIKNELSKQLIYTLKNKIHPHHCDFRAKLKQIDYFIIKRYQLRSWQKNPLNNIKLQYKLNENADLPPIVVHEAKLLEDESDSLNEVNNKTKCLSPIHWIIIKQLSDTLNNPKANSSKATRKQLEAFQKYMSAYKPFSIENVEPWRYIDPTAETSNLAVHDDEDIFADVGKFDINDILREQQEKEAQLHQNELNESEDVSKNNLYDTSNSNSLRQCDRASSLERLQYFTDTPEKSSKLHIPENSSAMEKDLMESFMLDRSSNLHQKLTMLNDDGYENFQEYGFDDDFISQTTTKKKLKSSRDLRRQAERQYKQIGKVLENKSYKNLTTLEKEIAENQNSNSFI